MRATTCVGQARGFLLASLVAGLLAPLQGFAAGHVGDVATKDDLEARKHTGDVKSLDDFEARWAERRKGPLHRSTASSSHREKAQSAPHHTAKTEHHGTADQASAKTTAEATQPATAAPEAQASAKWLHEGVIVGTVKEQMLHWTNRQTGESRQVPRTVLVGRTGDEALMPTAAEAELKPYMGKLAKILCTAIVVPPSAENGWHHNLVVEQVVKVEPYAVEDETPSQPPAATGAAGTTGVKAPAPAAK